jgi:DNA-binding MarR family transcriptional regulator
MEIEERALCIIADRYPIDIKALSRELRISLSRTELLVKRMEIKGLVVREILPDKVYLRLTDGALRSMMK